MIVNTFTKDMYLFLATFIIGGLVFLCYYAWAIHIAATYPHITWLDLASLFGTITIGMAKRKILYTEIFFLYDHFCHTYWDHNCLDWTVNFKYNLFHWWFIAFILLYALEARHFSTDPQNLDIIYPIVSGLGGITLANFISQSGLRRIFSVLAAITMLCSIFFIGRAVAKELSTNGLCRDLHELGVALKRRAASGDLVVSMGINPVGIYYSGLRGWVFPPAHTWYSDELAATLRQRFPARISALRELENEGAKWLMIPSAPGRGVVGLNDNTPFFLNHINNHYELVYRSSAGQIFRYSKSP